ncbi:hypothetical protein NIIDMKKI_18930 [Mycobacterium kansasii]|uniref:Uncharacterized protein n=1 Tax=Mycobacterium kansasii TaxID=1768 RepID=A0A7G1I6T9_MYCKA|nr:hypothetical protein NIIDMKKI_18930 [Mycobacterium kansasii]
MQNQANIGHCNAYPRFWKVPDTDWNLVHCHQPKARQPHAALIARAISAGLRRCVVDTLRRYRDHAS